MVCCSSSEGLIHETTICFTILLRSNVKSIVHFGIYNLCLRMPTGVNFSLKNATLVSITLVLRVNVLAGACFSQTKISSSWDMGHGTGVTRDMGP